jgi:transcriptional regulator with XRE-family HTH domain
MQKRLVSWTLADRREFLGLKQNAIAAAAGLSRPYISRIESGKVIPPGYQHARLAQAYQCSLAEFRDALANTHDTALFVRVSA